MYFVLIIFMWIFFSFGTNHLSFHYFLWGNSLWCTSATVRTHTLMWMSVSSGHLLTCPSHPGTSEEFSLACLGTAKPTWTQSHSKAFTNVTTSQTTIKCLHFLQASLPLWLVSFNSQDENISCLPFPHKQFVIKQFLYQTWIKTEVAVCLAIRHTILKHYWSPTGTLCLYNTEILRLNPFQTSSSYHDHGYRALSTPLYSALTVDRQLEFSLRNIT
jgi:hypothetical protein